MQYLLEQEEFDALTPVKRLQERNEALEVAKEIILELHGTSCEDMIGDCGQCPIGRFDKVNDDRFWNGAKHICIRRRGYSK